MDERPKRKRSAGDRGLFERPAASGVWWIRYHDESGREHGASALALRHLTHAASRVGGETDSFQRASTLCLRQSAQPADELQDLPDCRVRRQLGLLGEIGQQLPRRDLFTPKVVTVDRDPTLSGTLDTGDHP